MLNSALNRLGWVFGGSVSAQKFGRLWHGRRITVQAAAAGRHRRGMKRGKMKIAGRLVGHHYDNPSTVVKNEAKGKCVHSFSTNVTKGTQNAGKW